MQRSRDEKEHGILEEAMVGGKDNHYVRIQVEEWQDMRQDIKARG